MADFNINIQFAGFIVNSIIEEGVAGETLLKGEVCYYAADGKWYKATSSDVLKCSTEIRLALDTIVTDATGELLKYGIIGGYGTLTQGDTYYIGNTPGAIVDTVIDSEDYQRYLGTAGLNDTLIFNPDATYVKNDGTEIDGIALDLIYVYNDTGGTLFKGKVIYPAASFGGVPSVALAIANTHENIERPIAVVVEDILDGTFGWVKDRGIIKGFDTSGLILGAPGYLSAITAGELTAVRPEFPNYAIQVGGATIVDGVNGEFNVRIRGNVSDTFNNIWNGTIRESFTFDIVDDGAGGLEGELAPDNGHPNLTAILSDGLYTITATPPETIVMTAGTDTNPQKNYVYFNAATKVLISNTSGFPSTQHIKIGTFTLQSVASTLLYGALESQVWNDHVEDTITFQGHLSHMTERLRLEGAKYISGVETTSSTPTVLEAYIVTTGGIVSQLHIHNFPAFDTSAGDVFRVWNAFTNAYSPLSNVYDVDTDSSGTTLDNSSFSLVLSGSINSGNSTGNIDKLFIGVPSGVYPKNSPELAVQDANNFSNYSLPPDMTGTGFLIARLTYIRQANGDISLHDIESLTDSARVGGGGGGGTGVTTFTALTDTPNSYLGQGGKFTKVGVGETGLEFDDILRVDLATIPLAYTDVNNSFSVSQTINGNIDIVSSTPLINFNDSDLGGVTSSISGSSGNIQLKSLSTARDFTFGVIGGAEIIRATGDGKFGINTNNPSEALDVVGNGLFSGTVEGADATAATHFVTKQQLDTSTIYGFACSNETSALVVDLVNAAYTDYIQIAFTMSELFVNVSTELPTGAKLEVDLHKNGTTIFTTKPTIDIGEATSNTASVTQVITGGTVSFAKDDKIEVFITQVGSTLTGKGLKCKML